MLAEMPKCDTVGPTAVCPLQQPFTTKGISGGKIRMDGRTVTVEIGVEIDSLN